MNINNLSTEEIIRYMENGVIDSISANNALNITSALTQEIEELKQELKEEDGRYDEGYSEAIEKMREALDSL